MWRKELPANAGQQWATAAEIPAGVKIRPLGWWNSSPTYIRASDTWARVYGGWTTPEEISSGALTPDRWLDAVWNPTGSGFAEVLDV